ncbi:MAG: response regulator [Bacteroidia bacterium]
MVPETREHIFIVDDNEIYSMMLDYILSKESTYKFSSFKSGEECVRNLYQNPDVVVLDYTMPGMNGYDVLREIKKYNPDIHVIILTGQYDAKLAAKLLKSGADDYILKQGHGEKQVMEKIDALLLADEWRESINAKFHRELLLKRVGYFSVIVLIVLAGVIIFKLL